MLKTTRPELFDMDNDNSSLYLNFPLAWLVCIYIYDLT